MTTQPHIRYAKSTDGVSIAYYAIGNGPAVVYLPPTPITHIELEWKVPELRAAQERIAKIATFVRYDSRGFGLSTRDVTTFSLAGAEEDLDAVITALGIKSCFLMATGPDAMTAIAYAAHHPERVGILVLNIPTADGKDALGSRYDLTLALARTDWPAFIEMLVSTAGRGSWMMGNNVLDVANSAMSQETTIKYLEALRGFSAADLLPRITAPTLVIGRRALTHTRPEYFGRIAAEIPNASHRTLEGSSASLVEEDVSSAINEFLATTLAPLARRPSRPPSPSSPSAASEPPTTSGTAVVLMTDIVDSTALTERLGDAGFRDASRALDRELRGAIRDNGGTPVDGKVLGDGVMGTFPTAAQAIAAALRCSTLSAASELQLHIGLHAGDVLHEDNNVYGGTVNIASRICGLSAPGEILVSDVVRGMARSSASADFEDRGEQEMKGVGDPVHIYAVRGGA